MGSAKAKQLRVGLRWAERLIDVRHFGEGEAVTAAAFGLDSPDSGLTLARLDRGEAKLFPSRGAGLELRRGETLLGAEEVTARMEDGAVALGFGERAELRLGTLAFDVACAEAVERVVGELPGQGEVRFFKLAAFSFLGFVALVTAVRLTPVADDDGPAFFRATAEVLRYVAATRVQLPKVQFDKPLDAVRPETAERRFDRPQPSKESPIVRGSEREKNLLVAKSAGLLGVMDDLNPAAKSVFSGNGLGAGINNALEGMRAGNTGLADSRGLSGLTSRGTGPGGPGGDVGLGWGGPLGRGPVRGGAPRPELRGRSEVVPPTGPTHVSGGLPREVILKVVKRHQSEIKYCYDAQLSQARDLAGKVAVLFVIDPGGAVSEAAIAESTLSSDPVEACMLGAIRRWKFPEPAGGGTVSVTFPWVFRVAGQGDDE
jgi:TonB family protein